jgi:hypothetical protein
MEEAINSGNLQSVKKLLSKDKKKAARQKLTSGQVTMKTFHPAY